MGPLSFLKTVYDLDTLDTRFTSSSSTPYQTVIDARNDPAVANESPKKVKSRAEPSKWNTPEFYLYFVVIAWAIPFMFWVAYDVSRPSDPRYHKFQHWLFEGWVPGRRIDLSDFQYRTFRWNLPYTVALLVIHPLLRTVWNAVHPARAARGDDGRSRFEKRVSFDYGFAFVYLVALHGFSALKVLLILWINFQLATKLPKRYVPAATWAFNICILFSNELCQGYHYKAMAARIAPPASPDTESFLMQWGAWLDSYGGLITRWEILFNITVLRLISFNLDYYWSGDKHGGNALEKKQLDATNLSDRDRVSIPADPQDYCFRNYVAYAIYAPLYLAGPIMTFNEYVAQTKYRAASIETPRTIKYALRFVLVLLAMELILHFNYVGAISSSNPVWSEYTAAQLSLLSFFNLHIIWLKLLLPWRLFRLWALIDGIDPPENMVRCVSNNFSTRLFWRAWHRSYNRWIIRYIYGPLGGASFRSWQSAARSIATYLMVFTFVALWHDIQLRLLIWGWLIVFFMIPEFTGAALFPARKWEGRPTEYRMLCCVGAVANVLMMISANLVGFAVGLDGLESILRSILHDWSGLLFLITACASLFVGIQVMFEIRESEKRRGITIKC
ncbi:hypothetical protein S7711_07882 [Stachybotrys chartarum IBT 7711]|uniref:Uncharacterized protein n=1 Tax=Stachybotrys chartarum (strain CBS 109288 / IBT 7711) TaxID=1280523 RepID=A0A084AK04_STACB|nr:hypothetical protein S7711_07882 [Stachybotrys chartarum IBT 7711]KFA48958.1 hypothetical protein S40293_02588 [Stachybotrys chartarum IBT 40293]KFA76476.1 hypothetical protein S40288_06499 [Stachybotrys chartarum IBT 40288]